MIFFMNGESKRGEQSIFPPGEGSPVLTSKSLHMLEMNQTFLMKKPHYPNILSQSVFSWLGQNYALQMPGVCAVI